jgi:hypothetical protein
MPNTAPAAARLDRDEAEMARRAHGMWVATSSGGSAEHTNECADECANECATSGPTTANVAPIDTSAHPSAAPPIAEAPAASDGDASATGDTGDAEASDPGNIPF